MSDSQREVVLAQADKEAGAYLFNSASNRRLTNLNVNIYDLRVDGGLNYRDDREQFTSTAAYFLGEKHGIPVVPKDTLEVVALGSLSRSVSTWGRAVTAEKASNERVELNPETQQDRELIDSLVESDLRRAIPESRYDFRYLNNVTDRKPAFGADDDPFAAHHTFELKVDVTANGRVLLHVDVGHDLKGTRTIAEDYSHGDELPQATVQHDLRNYYVEGEGELRGWSDYSYTEEIPDVGDSIAAMHEGNLDEDLRQEYMDKDPQMVELTYDGENIRHHLPQLLVYAADTNTVRKQSSEFHRRFSSKRAMMPRERMEYSRDFIQNLGRLPVLDLEFTPGPTNAGYTRYEYLSGPSPLRFHDDQGARTPSEGLTTHGVYSPPEECTVALICPERFETIEDELPPIIVKSLNRIGSPSATRVRQYELGSEASYSNVWHDLPSDTDVALVVVPDENKIVDFPVDDPYDELKRTLMRQGIPSQMMQKSSAELILSKKNRSLSANRKLLNILSALVAKAGGTPWQLDGLPGKTDAYLGLDVSYDEQSDQHTGASASVVLADGTTFAAESTTQQSGERFSAMDVGQFARDLVSDVAAEKGFKPQRLCLIRDGKLNEDLQTIKKEITETGASLDVVSIRKSGQPRVGEFDGTAFRIANKGTAFVSEGRDESILHSVGEPELKEGNSVGTPRTLRVIQRTGPTDIEVLTEQMYWLSEMHVGSAIRSTRIPVPIHYADLAASFVADGYVSPGETIRGPSFI